MVDARAQLIFSVYRSYLRQVRLLPHLYLCQFFQVKARDDMQKILSLTVRKFRERDIKTVEKLVGKIEKANQRDVKAFEHILDLAYGRKGKLKWELLLPVLTAESDPLPEPIIPGVEKSRPPLVSLEMRALLTSPHSRTTKPLDRQSAIRPRTLPARADPKSEEARLLGPFSKRREVNIRRRYFDTETRKVLPPLEVEVDTASSQDPQAEELKPRPLALQGYGVLQDVESVIGKLYGPRQLTRKERRGSTEQELPESEINPRHHSRWLRRRYRALLGRLPRLVCSPTKNGPNFTVKTSTRTFAAYQRSATHMPEADAATLAWLDCPEKKQGARGKTTWY